MRGLCVVEFEGEPAHGVCLGPARLSHSLPQTKHDDFVSNWWLASSEIFRQTGESLGSAETG